MLCTIVEEETVRLVAVAVVVVWLELLFVLVEEWLVVVPHPATVASAL
jgi:hypothetical protein